VGAPDPTGSDAGPAEPGQGGGALRRRHVEEIEGYVRGLGKLDLTFLIIRDELYGGAWDEVEHDLRARLKGKPFIFRLTERIEDSLARIARLKGFEAERGVDLRQVAHALGLDV